VFPLLSSSLFLVGVYLERGMKERDIVIALLDWFRHNARDLPWRRTRDPYAIWVSEIMLQQTQVKTVLPYWQRWMKALPTIQDLAQVPPQKLHKLWEGLGYYTRVRNLQKAAQVICREHGGGFPSRFDDVLALPGIGRYTAGAICSIAFNQPVPILDGNVMRVLTRLFGIDGDPRSKATNTQLWQLAADLVLLASRLPSAAWDSDFGFRISGPFNQSLMELGALICLPRQPDCARCPVARHCVALRNGRVAELPALAPRIQATARRFMAFVAEQEDRFLVRQRPAGVVNAHLWEFPNVEVELKGPVSSQIARTALGFAPDELLPLCVLKHSITRYRITLEVFRALPPSEKIAPEPDGQWLALRQLKKLPFTGTHRKILSRLSKPLATKDAPN
jgi:A/G-specific adenine glycosylase